MRSALWLVVLFCLCAGRPAGGAATPTAAGEPAELDPAGANAGSAADFTLEWFGAGQQASVVALPTGRQTLAGVDWDVAPGRALAIQPEQPGVRVPVGRRANRVHFLHTFRPAPKVQAWHAKAAEAREIGGRLPDRLTAFRYPAHYADGRTVPVNVRWNEGIGAAVRDWWDPVDGFVYDLARAKVAWQRKTGPDRRHSLVIYAMYWPNPRPGIAIADFTIEAPPVGMGSGVLLAVSTSQSERTGRTFFVAPAGEVWRRRWAGS